MEHNDWTSPSRLHVPRMDRSELAPAAAAVLSAMFVLALLCVVGVLWWFA